MKKIQIGGHYKVDGEHRVRGYALVDDSDFEWLRQYNWHLTSHNYAQTKIDGVNVYMHRLINATPKGKLTDHINQDTLDNRRDNLRTADKRLNSINRGLQSNNTSGHRGVSWNKKAGRWETYIWNYGKKKMLGHFKDLDEAIKVRQEAEGNNYAV